MDESELPFYRRQIDTQAPRENQGLGVVDPRRLLISNKKFHPPPIHKHNAFLHAREITYSVKFGLQINTFFIYFNEKDLGP